MRPAVHVGVGVGGGALLATLAHSPACGLACAGTTVLMDLDHAVDYVFFSSPPRTLTNSDYHRYITRGEKFPDYKPRFCLNGYTYAALSADGIMYNCINTECQGPSIYEMGIKKAWERLLEWRPDCVSCSSINCIETAMLLNFRKDILFSGLRLHRKSA